MGKGSAPSAPDPWQSAQAQYQYGTEAAAYNRALNATNTVGPTGSTSQKITGYDPKTGAPIYTQTNTLTPQQQGIFNEQQANTTGAGQVAGSALTQAQRSIGGALPQNPNAPTLQTQIDQSQIPGIIGAGDLNKFTQQQQQAAYQNQTQYLDPQFAQAQEQLDNQLRQSGAQPGSTAYDNAMKNFNLQKQQAYQSAFNNADQTGLAAQQALYGESANTNQQLYGQALQGMSARDQALAQQFGLNSQQVQQALALRDQPLNEYAALESGVNAQLPSFGLGGTSSSGNVAAPNISQAMQNQYEGQLAAYNANTATENQGLSSAATLAALYLMS